MPVSDRTQNLTAPVRAAEETLIGWETTAEGRLAVAAVLARTDELGRLVAHAVIDDPSERKRPIRTCSQCGTGRLHCVGRQRLASGAPGLGALVVCDSCGYYGGRR